LLLRGRNLIKDAGGISRVLSVSAGYSNTDLKSLKLLQKWFLGDNLTFKKRFLLSKKGKSYRVFADKIKAVKNFGRTMNIQTL
jgi:hypothetical protein